MSRHWNRGRRPGLTVVAALLCCGVWGAAALSASEPIETISLGGVEARGAALLLSGQSGGELEGAMLWTIRDTPGESGAALVGVFVEVEGRRLLEGSTGLPVEVEVYGYLLDDEGTVTGHLAEGLLIEDRRHIEMIREGGLKFVGEIGAQAGLYSLRIVVRNRATRRFFLARRDLEVPDGGSARLFVLPPLVAEPEGRWVLALQHDLDPAAGRAGSEGAAHWPAAIPAWLSRDPLEVTLGHSGQGPGRRISVEVVDPVSGLASEPQLELGPEIEGVRGLVFQRATIAAPDLPPGEYQLRVVVRDADRGETVAQALPVLIYEGLDTAAWTDEAAPRRREARQLPERSEVAAAVDLEDEAMRTAYGDALRAWARGDSIAARRQLAELERPPAGGDPARRWRRLFTIERLAMLALAMERPASLVGVAMLHRNMYGWYMVRRETDLAQHSWQMAAMIARMAPSVDGWEPPPGFSECLLLDLATRLAVAGDWPSARRALEVAVEVAPGSPAARLGLGALFERTGSPAEAAAELQKLVRDHADSPEGRLRLAVNRARLGSDAAAEELFRGLLEDRTPLWVRTIAYQELGSLLISKERAGEAVELLQQGVERIPANQRLRILELHALDRAGRTPEAAAAVEHLEVGVSQQSTSPRYRYSRWPDLDGERVRATLAAAEPVGRAALREALP